MALANQLNANFVRKWVKAHRDREYSGVPAGAHTAQSNIPTAPPFVPVTVQSPPPSSADIRIEIRRQETVVQISWPVAQSSACVQRLRELLR
ncbi:MAG: hypothetical protein ACRERU_15545 [Methylococcales bacterium]